MHTTRVAVEKRRRKKSSVDEATGKVEPSRIARG